MLKPTLVTLPETKLVGKKRSMSLIDNQTQALWQDFMPKRKGITNRVDNDFYSVQNYSTDYFENFNPAKSFVKWAAVAVDTFENIPNDMESFILPTGLYAVFEHKGIDTAIFQQIFTEWLPNSTYILDHRPHFELLGEKYKNGDPNSEEQIWIPIRQQ
ncbi:Transcription activator effector binding protein [Flavobacterium sp. 9R]|uniref:GyrI-like domain-containing protein n=1 Tax=Flavobacterium sp. 9R TaxID=2653143 RepID=UPI0012F33264|nr:GyrI-like domain-containing protein [Flavobacterium sp. 9R]VXC01216.1 Transcription activator effector binding protein [Flavobacterium sp. 9R]